VERTLESMSDAIGRLGRRGFAHELIADGGRLRDVQTRERYDPELLAIEEIVRFEGASDPDEQAILFALASPSGQPLGTWATAYGPAMPPEDVEVVRRLGAKRPGPMPGGKRPQPKR
jgi:hypothetical protein